MTDLTPVSSFDPVPQLETNTVALAGPGGAMNAQSQKLVNQTKYLNDKNPSLKDFYMFTDGADWSLAMTRASASGRNNLFIQSGVYGMNSTVFWPVGMNLICDMRGVTFRPNSGASLTSGFLMMWNSVDGSTWSTQFPNSRSGSLEGATFDNPNVVDPCRGVKLFGPVRMKDLSFTGYTQSIQRPASLYIDSTSIEHVICQNPLGNLEYQIELLGFGDAVYLNDLHFVYTRATSIVTKGLHLRTARGGVINNLVGGDHLFEQCRAILNSGMHCEQGQVTYSSSSIHTDSFEMYPTNKEPFIVTNEVISPNAETYTCHFSNGFEVYVEGLINPDSGLPIMQYDGPFARVANGCRVTIENVFRSWQVNGDLSRNELSGIMLSDLAGAPLTAWNNYSYILSRSGELGTGAAGRINLSAAVYASDTTFTGISSASLSGFFDINSLSDQWKIATGTYFYEAEILYDFSRLIGRTQTSSAWSVAVPTTAGMVRFYNGLAAIGKTCILRVYRGASAGSYDKYVDIHYVGGDYMYDTGNQVCGLSWISRSAGPVDAVNTIDARHIEFKGANVDVMAGARPNAGTWTRGDTIKRINTSVPGTTLLFGHQRLTTGSAHTSTGASRDWADLVISTV
jgi:hypothetical protein